MNEPKTDISQPLERILSAPAPLLKKTDLLKFVEGYFNKRDRYLAILADHPAPLYLQDSSVLRARANRITEAFMKVLPSVSFYYAVKSNNHPDIAGTLLQSGWGLDVSSGLELEMALELDAGDIVFSGPGKTAAELSLAASNSDRVTVLLDSFGEMEILEKIAAGLGRVVNCGVRLTVNPEGLWRKFGIPLGDLKAFWLKARGCDHINLRGLQFHSSWNLSPDRQINFIGSLGRRLADMPSSFRDHIEFIDIGGGYWPEQGEWLQAAGTPEGALRQTLGLGTGQAEKHHCFPSAPIEAFAEQIGSAIRDHVFTVLPCRICLEPGRWVCNDAVHLMITVVDKKANDLVITDAGTNAVGWERFETDYFPILNLTRPSLDEKPCHILGSLCTPHDVWGYMYFGEDIQPGDILMIPTQGAYTYSLRQNFIKPLPTVLTI